MNNTLQNRLKYHVTGAIERGEAQAIVEIPSLQSIELLDALKTLLKISEKELNQSATHDGLKNCEALAKARQAIKEATH